MQVKEPVVSVERIGHEGQPVVIIDDFSSNFAELLEHASLAQFKSEDGHYPGKRAPAPASYLSERAELLKSILIDVFALNEGATLVECNYSIVTKKPADLTVFQRLPHFDGTDEKRLALLHYCNDDSEGGTSFFRHRATGFETVSETRLATYRDVLEKEIKTIGPPPEAYFSGSSEQFELIMSIRARPNRMIIYRGCTIHSGNIRSDGYIGESVRDARLTINTFLAGREA